MQTFLGLFWGLLASCSIFAQSYHLQVRHLTMREGLPNYYVRHVLLDREGFARISTNYGYCRFDGYEMEVYNQPEGLSFNRPLSSYQDVNGLIWINYLSYPGFINWVSGEEKLIEVYNPATRQALSFDEYFGAKAPFPMAQIATVLSDANNHMWIVTSKREVYCYDGQFLKKGTLPETALTAFSPYTKALSPAYENFFIVKNREMYVTDRWSPVLYHLRADGSVATIHLPEPVSWMWTDRAGILWIAPRYAPQIWAIKDRQPLQILSLQGLQKISESKPEYICGASDSQERLWLFRAHSLYVFDKNGQLLYQHKTGQENFSPEEVQGITVDRYDNAWINTSYGVYIMSLKKSLFTNYLHDRGIQDTRGIFLAQQNRILVNQNGIHLLEPDQPPRKVINQTLLNFAADDSYLWSGSYLPIIYRFDKSRLGHAAPLPYDSIVLQKKHTKANYLIVHQSKKTGRLWVGGRFCFGYVDKAAMQFVSYHSLPGFEELAKSYINYFYEDERGIWIATDHGVYVLDETKGIVATYKKHFINQKIAHLHKDQAEPAIFWVATRGGGLFRWNPQTDTMQQFTVKNGLSNNVIYAVYEDDYGYLWLSSNYGLMRFNKKTHQVNTYLPEDGLPYHEFNHTSHACAPDGRLFFGGLKGVTSFYPKDFLQYDTNSDIPLRILNVEKLDRRGNALPYTADLLQKGKITLRPSEQSIYLSFSLLNHIDKNSKYAYFIERLDTKWTHINENYLRLNGLPYGNYTLHLKAQDSNGRWSQQELRIPIHVIKPFYQRGWFILLTLVLAAVLVYAAHVRRTWQLKEQNKKLEEEIARRTATIQQQAETLKILDEQKSNFFLNIAHELRTPLTLISSPISLFLEREALDSKVAGFLRSIKKNSQYLLDLVEGILNLSKLDAKQLVLEEQPVHAASLIQRIFAMYESYAEMHHIHYSIQYEADKTLHLLIDVPKFEKIIHNLLSNAIKFTPRDGVVKLQVSESADELCLRVSDTGRGIPPGDLPHIFDRYFQSKEVGQPALGGSGIGLAIAWEYTQLMNGTLRVSSELGKGTTFTLEIPKKMSATMLTPVELPPSIERTNGVHREVEPNAKQHKLLLVEDNVEMQYFLKDIVLPQYEVLQAENGAVALKILENNKVDGIITDLMMPQMDGFTFIERIKAHQNWRTTPVIVLTARANEQDKLQSLLIGVDDYLYKPFSPEELLVRIKNLLNNYQNRRYYLQNINGNDEILSVNEHWLKELENHAMHLLKQDPNFIISDVAKLMHMSERHLHRKIQELTGLTANSYLREIRLQRAKQLLEAKAKSTVSEIAYTVGFSSATYFTKVYIERFGKKPSEYI